jgi:hypothetical protein
MNPGLFAFMGLAVGASVVATCPLVRTAHPTFYVLLCGPGFGASSERLRRYSFMFTDT